MTVNPAIWFYADRNREQQGPATADDLAELFRDGRIDAKTLIWREGQAEWQPLSTHSAKFSWWKDLAQSQAGPPPIPPNISPPSGNAGVPNKGMGWAGGCAIAVVAGFFGVFVLGILAAIAIPAYQDYTQRALLMRQMTEAEPLKTQFFQSFVELGECPTDFDLSSYEVPDGFSEVWVGRFEDGTCGVQFIFDEIDKLPIIEGKKLWYWLDDSGSAWKCASEVEDKYLPAHCRG